MNCKDCPIFKFLAAGNIFFSMEKEACPIIIAEMECPVEIEEESNEQG